MARKLDNVFLEIKLIEMKELKLRYENLRSLAKEMMKLGNIGEYLRILNEMSSVQLKLAVIE